LHGRTDNVVKNHFYSTLRRQFRKISKFAKEIRKKDQKDISIEYLNQIMREHAIPLSALDNDNIKEYISELDKNKDVTIYNTGYSLINERNPAQAEHSYSLRESARNKIKKFNEGAEEIEQIIKEENLQMQAKEKKEEFQTKTRKRGRPVKEKQAKCVERVTIAIQVDMDEEEKAILKKTMDDAHLLVNVSNQIVTAA